MEHSNWQWTLHKTIPSSKEAGHRLIESLLQALAEYGWEGSDLFHVQMAAEEAMINAVTHGNQESTEKTVEIEFRLSSECAYLRFRDQGAGFCPEDLPDPTDDDHIDKTHGRGVFLIRRMMNEVKYNSCGNEVTMIKYRRTP